MPATIAQFGPGTLTLTPDGGAAASFECQVKSGGVQHAYETQRDAVSYLGAGCESSALQVRSDSLTFDVDHDLMAAGLYQFLVTNDRDPVDFTWTPQTDYGTATAASWSGTVTATLPDGVTGDEYGSLLSGSVTWTQSVAGDSGNFTFTAGADS